MASAQSRAAMDAAAPVWRNRSMSRSLAARSAWAHQGSDSSASSGPRASDSPADDAARAAATAPWARRCSAWTA